ncbi:MAG: hypothetical protein GQ536_06005 [Candidatus Aminicenantes bacterium]|nr:hypothetical protein [Candidatus Aminicenantes bacterium]
MFKYGEADSRLARIKNFSIVNILAGKRVVPELIQQDYTAERIFEETTKILASEKLRAEMKSEFKRIRNILGDKVAPQNAARELEKLIRENS